MNKKPVNKRLVSLLLDNKKIELITVNKSTIVCQCTKKFMPSDLKAFTEMVGQSPHLSTSEGTNYIILKRWG